MSLTFEITHDKEFLKHFIDVRGVFRLSPEMVEKLQHGESPYGRYGYGQWLYRVRPEGMRHNYDLFMGNLVPEDSEAAIREAQQEAEVPEASLLWQEQLGWFHEIEGRTEDARKRRKI